MSSQNKRRAPQNSQYGKGRGSDALQVQSKKDWHTLCSEFNLCKRKLEAKKDALLILAKELDMVRQEKDAYQLMAEQLREKFQAQRKKYEERERSLGLSLNESDPLSERRNHSLIQVLCEARQQNRKTEAEMTDLRQKLTEAQGDIRLLRENIARQRIGDDDLGARHFPAHEREELVKQLEESKEKLESLQRDMVAKIDEQEELVNERDFFRDKGDRLNQELNYVLGGDERRIVDIDALIMESKYLKERLKQCQEEKATAQNTVAKYKSALEKRRGKGGLKLGATTSGGLIITQKQVEKLLTEGQAGSLPMTQSSIADLRSLASTLLETIHDKNMALNHQRNTNKILGQRVAELEKKLKTLEIAGLWNLPPGTDINSIACCMLGSGGLSNRSSNFANLEKERMQSGLRTLIPHQITPDSSEVDSIKSDGIPSISGSATTSPVHQGDGNVNDDSLISLVDIRDSKDTQPLKSSKFGMERAASLDLQASDEKSSVDLPHSNSVDLDMDCKQGAKDGLSEGLPLQDSALELGGRLASRNVVEEDLLNPEDSKRTGVIKHEEKLITLDDDSSENDSLRTDTHTSEKGTNESALLSPVNKTSDMTSLSLNTHIEGSVTSMSMKDNTLISLEDESSETTLISAESNINDGDGKVQEVVETEENHDIEESMIEIEKDPLKKISELVDTANEKTDTDVYIVDVDVEDLYDEDKDDDDDDRIVMEEEAPFLTAAGEASIPSEMDEDQVAQFKGFFESVEDRIASKNLENAMGVTPQGLPTEAADMKDVEEAQEASSLLMPKDSEPRSLTVSREEVDSLPQCV